MLALAWFRQETSKNMRILQVVPTYLPAVRYGGPIASVHGLCKALAKRGHEVHVFTTNVDGKGVSGVPTSQAVAMDGLQVWYFPVPALRRIFWSPAMGRALNRHAGSFDVLHVHSAYLWPTWAAAREATRRSVPYVHAPRGMLVRSLINKKSPLAKKNWIRLIERGNLERAAAIHATSSLEAEELSHFGFDLPPVCVIPNGVTLESEDKTTPPSQAIASAIAETPYLLFIGRVNWKKGLDRLVAALKHVPQVRLLVAGNDEEGYRPIIEAQAASLGLSARIQFLGAAYGADKNALLKNAAVLVAPSYSENFGNVVLEAMAAGCPVVVTPEVGAAESVRNSGAGLVVEGDEYALGAGLAEILANPRQREEMGRRGIQAVLDGYTWDSVAQQMEVLYCRLLQSGQGRQF